MFTTLNPLPEPARRRKVESERIKYAGNEFYTSRLVSKKADNRKFLQKFLRECRVPVILPTDNNVRMLKYKIMLNTVLRFCSPKTTDAAFYDPLGDITCIFFAAVKAFRTVFLVSENDVYDAINENLLSHSGICAVRKQKLTEIDRADIIISAAALPFTSAPYVFGEYGWFVDNSPVFSCPFPELPAYADIYSAAAGIEEYFGEKRISAAYCENFSGGGVITPAESFFK